MLKKVLRVFLSMPAVILFYIPIILVLLEFGKISNPNNNWLRDTSAFILFWGGWFIWTWCFQLLRVQGEGMPLPNAPQPTTKLVREGPYRLVRNPMTMSLWAILFGEAIYFGSIALYGWTVLVAIVSIYYILKIEEPKMLEQFGQRYMEYRADVHRFL